MTNATNIPSHVANRSDLLAHRYYPLNLTGKLSFKRGYEDCYTEYTAPLVEENKALREALKFISKVPTKGHELEAAFDRMHIAKTVLAKHGGEK